MEENLEIPDMIDGLDDLLFFMDKSPIFQHYVMAKAISFFHENEAIIRLSIKKNFEKIKNSGVNT